MIANGLLEWENVPAETEGWRSVQMVTPVQLVNVTQYWVNVKRLGVAHVDNYYTLSLDTDAAYTCGTLRLWMVLHGRRGRRRRTCLLRCGA